MGLAANHGYKSLLEQAMEVSESDGYTGVYLSMDPWDSMVPEQRHRLYFMHLAPAHTHKLNGSNLTQPECLDVFGEAADVARFCNSNVLLGLKLQDFLLPSDHPEVQKARNQVQAKLDAPTPSRAAAKTRAGGRVNKKVLEMKAAMDEDDVVQQKGYRVAEAAQELVETAVGRGLGAVTSHTDPTSIPRKCVLRRVVAPHT